MVSVVLSFYETLQCNLYNESSQQYFPVVMYVALTFKSVNESEM